MVTSVRLAGPRGPVDGLLSEPRPGLVDAMMGLAPTMRLLTASSVRPNDLLTAQDGSRYRVVRVWPTPAGLVAELAKEA